MLTRERKHNLEGILESLKDIRDISDPGERRRVRSETEGMLDGTIPWPRELENENVFYIFDYIERGYVGPERVRRVR